jgi:hypothetical protein
MKSPRALVIRFIAALAVFAAFGAGASACAQHATASGQRSSGGDDGAGE